MTQPAVPPVPPPTPKCPDPDCNTPLVFINGQMPDKCEKCGFILEGWEDFFNKWFKVATKLTKAAEPVPPVPPVVKKKRGLLSNLGRK